MTLLDQTVDALFSNQITSIEPYAEILHNLGLLAPWNGIEKLIPELTLKTLITENVVRLPGINFQTTTQQTFAQPIASYVPQPEPFLEYGKRPKAPLKMWKRLYEDYQMASGTINLPVEVKASQLRILIGAEARLLLYAVPGSYDTETEIFETLGKFYNSKRTRQFRWCEFYLRVQRKGEQLTEFALALNQLAQDCQFNASEEDNHKQTQFINGILNQHWRQLLLAEEIDTFENLLAFALKIEREERVLARNTEPAQRKSKGFKNGGRCGFEHVIGVRSCPAFNKRCNNCYCKGHYTKMCKARKEKKRSSYSDEEDLQENKRHRYDDVKSVEYFRPEVKIMGRKVTVLADTGSPVTLLNKETAKALNLRVTILEEPKDFAGYTGNKIEARWAISNATIEWK